MITLAKGCPRQSCKIDFSLKLHRFLSDCGRMEVIVPLELLIFSPKSVCYQNNLSNSTVTGHRPIAEDDKYRKFSVIDEILFKLVKPTYNLLPKTCECFSNVSNKYV